MPFRFLLFLAFVTCAFAVRGITVLARLRGLSSHAAQGLEGNRVDDTRVIVARDVAFHLFVPPIPVQIPECKLECKLFIIHYQTSGQ